LKTTRELSFCEIITELVATFVRLGYRKRVRVRASARALASTLISFSSRLTLTCLPAGRHSHFLTADRGLQLFFEEYEFFGRIATRYTQLCESMRLPANIPGDYL